MTGKYVASARRKYWQLLYWTSIGLHAYLPKANGSYFILGHGHSGTNWLCNLLSDYLDIPVFKAWVSNIPAGTPQIFHMHRFLYTEAARKRTIYIYRDGRDVVISGYFKILNEPWNPKQRGCFEKYIGDQMDEKKVSEHLAAFIDWSFSEKRSSSIPWHLHVDQAKKNNYVSISFEGLKLDAGAELGRAIHQMTTNQVDDERLRNSIAKNDFSVKSKTGNKNFLRAGKSGDWKHYFNRQSAERFNYYAGRQLISLGYEKDEAWIESL